MAKTSKETLFLVSSAGTGFFYTLVKNKRKVKGEKKFAMMKYDPIAQKKVLFEQKQKLTGLKKKFRRAESAAASEGTVAEGTAAAGKGES